MSDDILDVAIVGGGVSGVYTAWRLLTADRKRRITLFEASDHIGGRLLSVSPPELPHMKAELGGMRILPAVQPRITKLIEALNRDAQRNDTIETYPFPVDEDANIAYLRGTYLRLADFKDHPAKIPYRLTFQEFGKVPGAIVMNAIEQIVPGITNPKLHEDQRRELAHKTEFDGNPLYEQGFWQVLMRVMSGEAYQLALAAGGYESTISNWNAADAIPWYLSDFGVTPEYRGFRKGFQQVPLTVAERFKAAGGTIECNMPLLGFEWKKEAAELHFKNGRPTRARALILAMPRRSLDLIADASPLLREEAVAGLIRSVTPRPLFKVFTTYMSPWWVAAGVEKGRTTTDLPVRQTYYWPHDDGSPVTAGRAMLMASYDDGINIGFWDGFRPKRGQGWRKAARAIADLQWFIGPANRAGERGDGWSSYPAPATMVAEIQRELALVHGLAFTPQVVDASFKDWGDDPFGGGWNSWNIGVRSDLVKELIIQPRKDAGVYICGEAYSDAQGWVEGALQTADMLLKKFDIKPLG